MMDTSDYIIMLHGIFRTNRSMRPVEKYFAQAGYQVINLSYPSLKKDIGGLADHLGETLKAYKIDPSKKLHFIGYPSHNRGMKLSISFNR
jgi:triacylglycerol lipase